jgi:hypothetical protein
MGTSLKARSVAKELFACIPDSTPRILINKEVVSFNDHMASPKKPGVVSGKAKLKSKDCAVQRNTKRKKRDLGDDSPALNSQTETAAVESGFDLVLRSSSDAAVQYLANGLGWGEDMARLVASPPGDIESPFNQIVYSSRKKRRIAEEKSADGVASSNSGTEVRDALICSDSNATPSDPAPWSAGLDSTTAYRTVRCGDRLFELQEYVPLSHAEASSSVDIPVKVKKARMKKSSVPSEAGTNQPRARRGRPRKVLFNSVLGDAPSTDACKVESSNELSISESMERPPEGDILVCPGSPERGMVKAAET